MESVGFDQQNGHGAAPDDKGRGRLADNIVYFARALRKAGLKIGPGAVTDAINAVEAIGIGSREEFYTALFSVLVTRNEDRAVFDEAFRLFWRKRDLINKMMQLMMPEAPGAEKDKRNAGEKRASDALLAEQEDKRPPRDEPELEIDSRFTMSTNEVMRKMDFAQMSAAELAEAKRALSRLVMPFDRIKTRRFRPSHRPVRFDPRATMRQSLRTGGDLLLPAFREQKHVAPPLVILADISGSMSQYTRIFLHFLHVMTEKRRRVHTFLFGTRLTNVTRQMRNKDPDQAMDECTALVTDWSGGTRIGETLGEFNKLWSRRVLGQGATVLLITDGLERDSIDELEREIDRLHRSCRRLIWLNPLLRFDGFEARARGVRAMLPHVDEFRSVHNLDSIEDLVEALALESKTARTDPRRFLAQVANL